MKIPVFHSPQSASMIAEGLMAHGIVVVDTMRTQARCLVHELREELGIEPPDDERKDADFLLHLSCDVEPVIDFGWVDYYVHSRTSPVDAMEAKELVRMAVRQWGEVGKPDYFVAKLNP